MLSIAKIACVLFAFAVSNCTTPLSKGEAHDLDRSSDKKIIFIENSWAEALKQAAKQHKYIFADAYASWCGPCKMLKATTFRNSKVAAFYNEHFINVSIDMEKGEGPKLSQQWGIQAYPTLIIFNADGKPLLGTVGYIEANDLLRFGEEGLKK